MVGWSQESLCNRLHMIIQTAAEVSAMFALWSYSTTFNKKAVPWFGSPSHQLLWLVHLTQENGSENFSQTFLGGRSFSVPLGHCPYGYKPIAVNLNRGKQYLWIRGCILLKMYLGSIFWCGELWTPFKCDGFIDDLLLFLLGILFPGQ